MTDSNPRPYGVRPTGWRLPDASHLGRVRLQVADLARSVDFYQTVLGMRVIERAPGVATLGPVGEDRVIIELHERAGANPVPRQGRLGLYHFAILLPDRPALGRLLRHLAQIGARAGMSDHAVSEAVYLTDPDGLGIEVYTDRPRSAWRHEGGELEMTTVPLDAVSVVGSAGDAAWDGMPAGTVLGHVHLHVGDLAAAEAFYHEALGFDKVVWSYPGALFMSAGGYHHHLGTNTWAARAPKPAANDARLIDWEVLVPDALAAEGAARSLEAAGFPVERTEGGFAAADPWGTTVRVTSYGTSPLT